MRALCFDFAAKTFLNVREWIIVGFEYFTQQCNVCYCQSQCVDFAQTLLVRKCWYMNTQLIKRRIDASVNKIGNLIVCTVQMDCSMIKFYGISPIHALQLYLGVP